ncbi:enoyl-CoA hydratase/isomerase family protein [Xinfangfangia pollutisoli]|uniref:enoyl-CoA hydratase/isomerase family protein n=1 Tax=Xinfangfangia pollutisoli TaxID=2865960 RepID=UPI001CD23E78|nr:enoyl-CoA hydratase/isomerase family protein [Xinfangfangia pollutisoli]
MSTHAMTLTWPEPDVALVTLTRGSAMNTLSHDFLDELEAILDELGPKPIRAMILTGSGRAFCCGAHLDYFEAENMGQDARFRLRDSYLNRIAALFDRLEEQPWPTIAAINGYALGGGCELALSCDFRIMAKGTFLGLPEVKLGALAGAGGVQKLSRHVGRSKAMEWILLGSHIPAEEAERRGLLYAIAEPEALLASALDLAGKLRALSPRAIAQSKASVYLCEDADLRTARKFGLESLAMLIDSRDWQIGIKAFHGKTAPDFS